MLIEGFYTIEKLTVSGSAADAVVVLNPNHEVYRGHFPGQPVVPGVIQLQMIKEILEKVLESKLMLYRIISAKYYTMITPAGIPELELDIQFKPAEKGEYKIVAQIKKGETVFTKVRAVVICKK